MLDLKSWTDCVENDTENIHEWMVETCCGDPKIINIFCVAAMIMTEVIHVTDVLLFGKTVSFRKVP